MDSINPIAPGPPAISPMGRTPVERLERVARERDRPAKDHRQRKRREPVPDSQPEHYTDDDGHLHIDVRA